VPAQSSKRDPPSDLVPAPFGISPIIYFVPFMIVLPYTCNFQFFIALRTTRPEAKV